MKKSIFVLLLALLLCLCACSEVTAGIADAWESGMNGTAGVTEKHEDENTVEIPATAIRLKVSFGPEFEVVMTDYLRILMVTPANPEAETLLEGLNLVDRCHIFAFGDILAAAQAQGYLNVGNTIKMTASAQDSSAWNNASRELLMYPVDAFRQETGALFGCYVLLPEAAEMIQLDLSLIAKAERTTEEGYNVYYPTGAVSGYTAWRSVTNYNDGRIAEFYAFSTKFDSARIFRNLDGVWEYLQLSENTMNRVWEGPNFNGYSEAKGRIDLNSGNFIWESASGVESFEGRTCSVEESYNAEGNCTSRTRAYTDGSFEEVTFYDNGEFHTRTYKGTDGVHECVSFFPNGNMESMKLETADGYYEGQWTEDGKFVYQKIADAGMTNVREAFYDSDGKPTKVIIDGVPYEDQQMLSQFS